MGRLARLGLVLPEPTRPLAAYVPVAPYGPWIFVAGQLPMVEGRVAYVGRVGKDLDLQAGREAARTCALMILAQLAALGPLEDFRLLKVTGFVAAGADFTQHPEVMDAASEFFLEVLGEHGRHARAAVGVVSLPRGAAVEVEAVAVRISG